jgi:hypothetical protein
MIQNYADSEFSRGNLWIDGSGSLSFLEMTPHKENSGKNEGEGNEHDYLKADKN